MVKEQYITHRDIEAVIDEKTLNMLLGGTRLTPSNVSADPDYSIIDLVIPAALETVRGYIRHSYDAALETRQSYIYNGSESYEKGDRVYSLSKSAYYIAISDVPVGTPINDDLYFEQRDDRNPKLVDICSVIIVYALFRRVNPRLIPEQRQCDLDDAMKVLRDVQAGRLQLDICQLPKAQPNQEGGSISWGSFSEVVNEIY